MRAEKPVSIRRDWCAKTLAGTVLGFALALIASDLFSTLANDIPAAIRAQLDRKIGRLVLEYREGEYVQSGLWIVRQHLKVVQQDGKQGVYAECVANASEYHRYRRAFADICLGLTVRPVSAKG